MAENSIKPLIKEAIKVSMKSGEKEKTITLRMAIHEIQTAEKIKRTSLTESYTGLVIQSMIKQRKESMSQFQSAGRDELAQKEGREIEILSEFLPLQLSEEKINLAVKEAIENLKAETPQDIGKVMGSLKPSLQGKADMSLVSKIVKESLAK
ncbi:MAG TPA: GatB/YqeY domain-containing protein [Gammaproteobacteria bacterium]|nr:GatB/YqeY domain-containing protein [Gammaproteobacteria bacterium]